MTYRELNRKLNSLGCEFDRQSRGSHEIWRNPATGTRTTIPNWGRRDLRIGTVRAIVRDRGLDKTAFDRA
ncbi:type II toxin-antitoxin system HicA family toxin [Candidatus Poriferisodalis sp.]|uniref:type II toxin-antitoxin system HicA family toxin n=1 Tax=Candidatus Poriferisodalis sp. TaxID=3101277 RepID=UPI003C705E72